MHSGSSKQPRLSWRERGRHEERELNRIRQRERARNNKIGKTKKIEMWSEGFPTDGVFKIPDPPDEFACYLL
jgi:hypothetical protein